MKFICYRLSKALLMGDLTEVPVPTKFLFILLGPMGHSSKYHEIGRSIATLMSDEVWLATLSLFSSPVLMYRKSYCSSLSVGGSISKILKFYIKAFHLMPGHVALSVGHLIRKSEVLGLIPGLATYFCFSFR